MSIRNIDIIIAVITGKTLRFDAASGTLLTLARKERTGTVDAVLAILKAKPLQRGARVFVMASDFFTQVVRLPAQQTQGLSQEELLSVLVFEVEPFSNMSRDVGEAAYTAGEESAGIFAWHVLQVSKSEITAFTAALRAVNAKLIGLAQADGLLLSASEQELPGLFREVVSDVVTASHAFPVIVPAPSGLGVNQRALLACLVLGISCSACWAHCFLTHQQISRLQDRVGKVEALESANAQLEAAVKSVQSKIDALEKKHADRVIAAKEIERYRRAWAALIRSIPETCGNDVVIQQIAASSAFDAEVTGLSMTEKGPGECMAKLAQCLCGMGWKIHSERLQAVNSAGGNNAVRFTFHVSLDYEIKQ